MTEEQKEIIFEKAESANLTASSFLLKTGLSKHINTVMKLNLHALTEIKSIRENLDQLIEILHRDKQFDLAVTEILVLKIHNELTNIREGLYSRSPVDDTNVFENEFQPETFSQMRSDHNFIN